MNASPISSVNLSTKATVSAAHRLQLEPISTPHRLLLGPGPSNADPRVLQAIARPPLSHLDPLYLELMNEVQEMLRYATSPAPHSSVPGKEDPGGLTVA